MNWPIWTDHVADAVRARIQGREGYGVWFRNLKPFFDKAFGKGWRDKDRPFWNTFDDKYKQLMPAFRQLTHYKS